MSVLVLLKVADTDGRVSRDVIVPESISMFNLHRVLQFCIKPNQGDSTIDGKGFSFTHVSSGKLVKALKSTQLYRANPNSNKAEVIIGDSFMYKPADKGQYLVQIVESAGGDDKFYVPRCISGNIDVDTINKKLLNRRFTKTGAGRAKQLPGLFCPKGTPKSALMGSHMMSMREPLGGWQQTW